VQAWPARGFFYTARRFARNQCLRVHFASVGKIFLKREKVTPISDTECLSTEVPTPMNKAIAALLNDPLKF
jgi:hypothetical protein